MKVKELIEILKDCDPNAQVVMQKDAEGNGYSPLAGADHEAVYIAESTWSGMVYSTEWTADDACMDENEWKKILKRKRCIVLFPVN